MGDGKMLELDIRTLSLSALLFSFVFGLGLLGYGNLHRQFIGIRTIGCGLIVLGLGYILLGLRGVIDDFSSIIIANLAIFSGFYLFFIGFRRLLSIDIPRLLPVFGGVLIILAGGLSYNTYVVFDVNARIIIFSACMAALYGLIAYALWRSCQPFGRLAVNFLTVSFALFALFFVFRVFWTATDAPLLSLMGAGLVSAITVLDSMFIILSTAFAVIWIASDALQDELKQLASVDGLTKILNRRSFEEACMIEDSRSLRSATTYSIIMSDLDHFKSFNDTYGHQLGDRVLREFAQILKTQVRKHDIVARYGGEEFVVLLPDTDEAVARKVAEKLRGVTEAHEIAIECGKSLSITASFGVASKTGVADDWEAVLRQADIALYEAKDQGRNRVMGAEIASAPPPIETVLS